MSRAYISTWRQVVVALVVAAFFGALLARLYQLQVLRHSYYLAEAERTRDKLDIVTARRGDIVDTHGNVLATTQTVYDLGVDPQAVKDDDLAKVPQLAAALQVPEAQLRAAFMEREKPVEPVDPVVGPEMRESHWNVLQTGLDETTYKKVAALKLKAVYGQRRYERVYPGGELAAHILGFLNKEGQPAMGVEAYMDFYLRGQDGWVETERDGHRVERAEFNTRDVKPVDGLRIELTIDQMLQYYAEQRLKKIAADYQPISASIIISDPATGEILALANYPTFDPNRYSDVRLENLRDRAVSDSFEPGSTFKIVTASAAVNEGLVQPDDKIDCSKPTLEIHGRPVNLPHDHEVFGLLTISEIVAESSNRGAANLGVMLGEDRLYNYARAYGFGQATNFGLGGEQSGDLKPVAKWDGLTITRMPMGQGVTATALQVHDAMATIANRGVFMAPQIVRRVTDAKGNTIVDFPPEAKRRVVSEHTAAEINEMLCNVVGPEGTAIKAKLQDITVAGKTGTAQKVVNGKYSNEEYVSSFTGYFPAERPRLVMTVVVNDAHMNGTAYGGLVAAPAFHDVAQQAVTYLGIQPAAPRTNLLAMKGDNLDWFR